MKLIQTLLSVLFLSLSLSFFCLAAQAAKFECPLPSQIRVLPVIPGGITPLPGLALWFAPPMSTSVGGSIGFGVTDGIDASVGPFLGSGERIITINGKSVPGYYCTYGTKISLPVSEIQKQIKLVPPAYRSMAEKLISQGPTTKIGTMDYVLKKSK